MAKQSRLAPMFGCLHLVSVLGMSYTQVTNLLLTLYGLVVSGGEIAAILQAKHQDWLPAYNQLKVDIRAAPIVHADETPWPIQVLQGAGYAWTLADAGSPKVCFALEQSRGATNAQTLFGQGTDRPFAGIRVSDDYGPYRNPEDPEPNSCAGLICTVLSWGTYATTTTSRKPAAIRCRLVCRPCRHLPGATPAAE